MFQLRLTSLYIGMMYQLYTLISGEKNYPLLLVLNKACDVSRPAYARRTMHAPTNPLLQNAQMLGPVCGPGKPWTVLNLV